MILGQLRMGARQAKNAPLMTTMSAMSTLANITTTLVTHVVYKSVALLLDVAILRFPLFIIIVIFIATILLIIQVVRESVWSSLDSTPGSGTELLTLAKTSNLSDLQVRISWNRLCICICGIT